VAAVAVLQEAASGGVPAALVTSTVKAAAGSGVAGVVWSLVERVVRVMLVAKLKVLAAVVFLVGAVGSGTGWVYYHRAAAAEPGEDRAEQEALRDEMKRFQADLRRVMDRAAALEARLEGMGKKTGEVLFRGKPAAYWIKALEDRDPKYRTEAVQALGGIGVVDRAVLPLLAGAMKDDEAEVAREAADHLARGGKAAIPFLITSLKDPGHRNMEVLLIAFRRLGPDAAAAVSALTGVLQSSKPAERRAATEALGSIGPDARAAVPVLVALLTDPDAAIRQQAIAALGGIGPEAKGAVQPLIEVLKAGNTPDGWYAANALGRIGPEARPAVRALVDVLRQGASGGTAQAVIDALEQIDPEAARKAKEAAREDKGGGGFNFPTR
jgi:HEAT repeat protein